MFISVLYFRKLQEQNKPTPSQSALVFIFVAQPHKAYPVISWFGGRDGNWQPSRRL